MIAIFLSAISPRFSLHHTSIGDTKINDNEWWPRGALALAAGASDMQDDEQYT
jgi:hypothetical protein